MGNINSADSQARTLENAANDINNIIKKFESAKEDLKANNSKKIINDVDKNIASLKKCQSNLKSVAAAIKSLANQIKAEQNKK